jgi:hypothetical protein
MTSNLSVVLKKYSVPAIFFVTGIAMVAIGASSNQTPMWFVASLMVLAAGALSMVFSGGFLKTGFGKIIGYGAGIAAIFAVFLSWTNVSKTMDDIRVEKKSIEISIENLNNVRSAQKAFREKFNRYAGTWKELEDFISNGTVPEVMSKGFVPARKLTEQESKFIYKDNRPIDNNMTEFEAYQLSKYPTMYAEFKDFKRDTIQVSYMKKQFLNETYTQRRDKANYGKFYVDSLKYIPFTNAKQMFKIAALDSVPVGAEKLPCVEVKGNLPFGKKKEIFFGSLTVSDLSGSWE